MSQKQENQYAVSDAPSGVDSEQAAVVDAAAEKALVRKLDLHILPLIMGIYIFSFLDRVNIGNARLYGLEEDLQLRGNQFQIAVSILFATYISVELPSNWIIKKVHPSRWIAFITTSWGIIATLAGVTHNFAGLMVIRVLLGAFEGGLFPGLVTYLTFFYTKREIGLRIAGLFACSALAGACGGLLAFAIGFMDGLSGQRGWRWIFIIEGLPTIILGITAWFVLADDPSTAKYFSKEERELSERRLNWSVGQTASAKEFHWKDVRQAFKDWKVWLFCFAQFGVDTSLYGFATFLPTIIKGIDPSFSNSLVQVLTIPCYSLGAICYLITGHVSDKQQKRGVWIVIMGTVSVAGYGMFVVVGIPLAWLPTNTPRYGKRSTTIAMQAAIGNSAGIMAPFLYPKTEGPRYIKGHAITMALLAFGVYSFGYMWIYYAVMNKRRREGKEDAKVAGLSEEEVAELGDDSPKFIYAI